MPTIEEFDGFLIAMYFKDHNPPHVHVVTPNETGLVSINDCAIFAGSIDQKFRREALEWIVANRNRLLLLWGQYK